MPSKWINKDLFGKYVSEKEAEEEQKGARRLQRRDVVWATPQMGTTDKPKVYEGRFLPDSEGNFTKKYFYHMFRSGESWQFFLCPKTHKFENWCPWCTVTSKLYMGTQKDKTAANNYKRKAKNVSNFFIADDPRDAEQTDEAKKVNGKTKLYEFPDKVDSKIKAEITDKKNGLGDAIFDPGDTGYNFILKVRSTKPDALGKTFSDYSDSVFARRPAALGDDAAIRVIMDATCGLDDYITGLDRPLEDTKTVLKNEMLWDYVKDEWARYYDDQKGYAKETETPKANEAPKPEPENPAEKNALAGMKVKPSIPKALPKASPVDDLTDAELLKELEKI